MAKKTVAAKKRNVKVDAAGQLHVHSSFNNIIVCLANSEGQVISWSSAGKMGFRGSKKNTPYAAQMAAQDCAKVAYDLGLRKVKAYVKGPGNGRESAIRTIHGAGIEVTEIVDVDSSIYTIASVSGWHRCPGSQWPAPLPVPHRVASSPASTSSLNGNRIRAFNTLSREIDHIFIHLSVVAAVT